MNEICPFLLLWYLVISDLFDDPLSRFFIIRHVISDTNGLAGFFDVLLESVPQKPDFIRLASTTKVFSIATQTLTQYSPSNRSSQRTISCPEKTLSRIVSVTRRHSRSSRLEFTPVLNRGWNLLWFEEPISLEHIDVLAEITHAISTPIMWVRISAYTTGSMTYWGIKRRTSLCLTFQSMMGFQSVGGL